MVLPCPQRPLPRPVLLWGRETTCNRLQPPRGRGGGAAQTGEQAFALVALWDISPAVILWEKESLKTRGGESSSSVVPHLQPSKNACATLLSVTKFPNTSLLSLVPLRSSESSACEYLVVGSC